MSSFCDFHLIKSVQFMSNKLFKFYQLQVSKLSQTINIILKIFFIKVRKKTQEYSSNRSTYQQGFNEYYHGKCVKCEPGVFFLKLVQISIINFYFKITFV